MKTTHYTDPTLHCAAAAAYRAHAHSLNPHDPVGPVPFVLLGPNEQAAWRAAATAAGQEAETWSAPRTEEVIAAVAWLALPLLIATDRLIWAVGVSTAALGLVVAGRVVRMAASAWRAGW